MRSIFLSICYALLLAIPPCSAATKIWISTNSFAGLWSDGANWQGGTAPVSGDRVAFRCCARPGSTNDISNLALEGIDFEWFHLIDGNGLDLTGSVPITVAAGQNNDFIFRAPIRFTAPSVFIDIPPESPLVEFVAPVIFSGGTATLNAPNTQINFGPVSDESPASLVIRARQVNFLADNTFQGTLSYTGYGGWLSVEARGMGAPSAGTLVVGNATLYVKSRQPEVIAEPLDLRMAGPNALFSPLGGPTVFQGPIAITGPQLFAIGGDTTFAGAIAGNGRLIVESSPYPMTLAASGNSFSGGLQVRAATVHLANDGVVPQSGELVIESGGVVDFASTAQGASRFTCAGTMAMSAGAVLHVAGTVDITGCALQLAFPAGYVAPASNVKLIDNTGNSPVAGAFNAMPEGTLVTVNGVARYLSYIGGDGNDVVLQVSLGPPLPIAAPRVQDMWWSPLENGWGMSIVEHGDNLFSVIYVYDDLGKPVWYVLPTGTWNSLFNRYTGDVYLPSGSPFFQYDVSRFAPGPVAGSIAISFDNSTNPSIAVLDYTIGGRTGRKFLSRQAFGRGTSASVVTLGNMYWGGAGQNGWGVAILQQGDTLFNVWFTYDLDGQPTWFVMPGGTWTTSERYDGRLYRTLGSMWLGRQYDASQLQVFDAGPYRLRFDGDSATLDYSIDGRGGSLRLDKQPF